MNKLLSLGIGWVLFVLSLAVVTAWGWILNIIALAHMTTILTGEGAVRIAGIFLPPLGAVMGWFF